MGMTLAEAEVMRESEADDAGSVTEVAGQRGHI